MSFLTLLFLCMSFLPPQSPLVDPPQDYTSRSYGRLVGQSGADRGSDQESAPQDHGEDVRL